jgi:hypothetical protein
VTSRERPVAHERPHRRRPPPRPPRRPCRRGVRAGRRSARRPRRPRRHPAALAHRAPADRQQASLPRVFAAIAVAASGAGVAAAVTLPTNGPSPAERARIVEKMDEGARSEAPSALLSRLGLPQTLGTTEARGLVLARAAHGSIVLLPAAVVADRARRGRGGCERVARRRRRAPGGGQTPKRTGRQRRDGREPGRRRAGRGPWFPVGRRATRAARTAGGSQTGTPTATNHGKKPAAVTKGGKKPAAPPTSTPDDRRRRPGHDADDDHPEGADDRRRRDQDHGRDGELWEHRFACSRPLRRDERHGLTRAARTLSPTRSRPRSTAPPRACRAATTTDGALDRRRQRPPAHAPTRVRTCPRAARRIGR